MKLRELTAEPLSHPLETGLEVYQGVFSIDELREPFLQTRYAKSLANMEPRFGHYSWDDKAKFLEYYGQDVDPMQHGPYQARTVGIPMLDAQRDDPNNDSKQVSRSFSHHFIAHHVQHDDHEGEFMRLRNEQNNTAEKGDVPYFKKDENEEIDEFNVWCDVQKSIFGLEVFSRHLSNINDFANPTSPELFYKRFWDASEAIGYLFTSLQSWHIANNVSEISPEERRNSERLALEVSGRHHQRLERVRREIVFADMVLSYFAGQLEELRRARGEK